MKTTLILAALVVVAMYCALLVQADTTIQPEPVTDPAVLRKLNCQMHCRNEMQDNSPDCVYNCISPKCYRKTFKKLIDPDTQRIGGEISQKIADKFDRCFEREQARIEDEL
mmetsp:Transcript_4433/g.15571  ORF Transcript_4433/g.15571 Transcript_4433/m.15571 type:complete len:111 (-) Transcript_4433:47-379(-)|eukprot:CAMPEP_0114614154 /NCGR_PEP_ID=MMETSP0168-20121206/5503_1 /TAXON_ID=95228 ORGANISM="Vannella sp., Strain DIVA3 517/6/12" /NCGR_SAMPLE_ID=MMETSP0168 /ASSEMBLY_ACC=CAM_ASM_000044 /LENGTH=110 /DNA_ID=CAMNT_0001825185 /DNA_START=33 /DNA_END=365 /DNA_ORIENTATION=+